MSGQSPLRRKLQAQNQNGSENDCFGISRGPEKPGDDVLQLVTQKCHADGPRMPPKTRPEPPMTAINRYSIPASMPNGLGETER